MKILLLSFFVMLFALPARSQAAEDSVKALVNQLFDAMRNSDKDALLAAFADSAVLQTIAKDKEGKLIVRNESVAGFAASVATAPKNALDERITFDVIKMDAALASVWTPYSFYYNGKFSHCGVNSFQLIRTAAGWKIQYLIDTRRKQNCL